MRGPNVFREYLENPEATAEAFVDGWLRTGDLGELDDGGYLTISGRKKDIIITAGGKNLTPANIENDLKQSRFISQAVMHGDRRPFPVALITLDEEEIQAWARDRDKAQDMPAPRTRRRRSGAGTGGARSCKRQVRPGGAGEEVHDPRPRPLSGGRRADPHAEGEARRDHERYADVFDDLYR